MLRSIQHGIGSILLLFILTGCTQEALTTTQLKIAERPFTVFVADSPLERTRGLADIVHLADDEGMIFLFPTRTPQTFWMKDVEYPIDIVWISQRQIVGYITAQPEAITTASTDYQLYQSAQPVDTVVELPAGTVARLGLQIGDNVVIGSTLDVD